MTAAELGLTPGEEDVLIGIADGLGICGVAETRGVSKRTVRNQLVTAYRKLGANNAAHAVALMYHKGLLVPAAP